MDGDVLVQVSQAFPRNPLVIKNSLCCSSCAFCVPRWFSCADPDCPVSLCECCYSLWEHDKTHSVSEGGPDMYNLRVHSCNDLRFKHKYQHRVSGMIQGVDLKGSTFLIQPTTSVVLQAAGLTQLTELVTKGLCKHSETLHHGYGLYQLIVDKFSQKPTAAHMAHTNVHSLHTDRAAHYVHHIAANQLLVSLVVHHSPQDGKYWLSEQQQGYTLQQLFKLHISPLVAAFRTLGREQSRVCVLLLSCDAEPQHICDMAKKYKVSIVSFNSAMPIWDVIKVFYPTFVQMFCNRMYETFALAQLMCWSFPGAPYLVQACKAFMAECSVVGVNNRYAISCICVCTVACLWHCIYAVAHNPRGCDLHCFIVYLLMCDSLSESAQLLELYVDTEGHVQYRPFSCDGTVGWHASAPAVPLSSTTAAAASLPLHTPTFSVASASTSCTTSAPVSSPAPTTASAKAPKSAVAGGMERRRILRAIWKELSEETKSTEFQLVDSEELLNKLNTLLRNHRSMNPDATQCSLFDTKDVHASRQSKKIAKALGLVHQSRKAGKNVSGMVYWTYTTTTLTCSATTAALDALTSATAATSDAALAPPLQECTTASSDAAPPVPGCGGQLFLSPSLSPSVASLSPAPSGSSIVLTTLNDDIAALPSVNTFSAASSSSCPPLSYSTSAFAESASHSHDSAMETD